MQTLRILARTRNPSLSLRREKDHSSFFSSDLYFSGDSSAPVWKTCLREVVFLSASISEEWASDWQALDETESLCYLTEVLCGLHSPLLGENEVFGQFKQFVEEQRSKHIPLFAESQKWLQFLIQNVKYFRNKFGKCWGSNSYGSLLRKRIEIYDQVTLFGTGHLAEEIFPWLVSSSRRSLQLAGRNAERMRFFASKCAEITLLNTDQDNERTLMRQDGFHSCLILSAPLSHEQTLQLIDKWGSKVQILFDLRGMESHKEENVFKSLVKNQFPGIEVIFLHELFQVLTYHREKIQSQIEEVKFLIRGKVDEFAHRLEHRPLGWDDLCA